MKMYLAGPEPHLDFSRGSLECVNTTSSGIEIRTIGLCLIRGDTTASIEVFIPVTVGLLVRSDSIFSCQGSVPASGRKYLPSLVAIRCHGAIGSRMERDTIRADIVDSLDYIDFPVG